ncbi:MAG: DUF4384 domain-containing protein [Blastocatellia bacterium]
MKTTNQQRFAHGISILGLISLLAIQPFAVAQQPIQLEEDQARGAFLISRKNPAKPFPAPTPKRPSLPQPSRQPGDVAKNKSTAKSAKTKPDASAPAPTTTVASTPGAPDASPIGVGYTLYQRNAAGEAVRVSPAKTFHDDDRVRFVIEPNIDGYLYIFVRTDDGEPEMLFPDHRLNNGANEVQAHVPYEAPSRKAEIKWFTFDENPGVEHIYIVVSRTPLSGVPAGKELIAYCKEIGQECSWKPGPQKFNPVLAAADEPKVVSASKTLGQVQAEIESEAITRGIKLKAEAPEPVLVQMNISASKDTLVMKTELIHRSR